jgi:hypothetical protein
MIINYFIIIFTFILLMLLFYLILMDYKSVRYLGIGHWYHNGDRWIHVMVKDGILYCDGEKVVELK